MNVEEDFASVANVVKLDIKRMIARYYFCEAWGLASEFCRDFSFLSLG